MERPASPISEEYISLYILNIIEYEVATSFDHKTKRYREGMI